MKGFGDLLGASFSGPAGQIEISASGLYGSTDSEFRVQGFRNPKPYTQNPKP